MVSKGVCYCSSTSLRRQIRAAAATLRTTLRAGFRAQRRPAAPSLRHYAIQDPRSRPCRVRTRHPHDAIRGFHRRDVIALRGADAEHRGVLWFERDHQGTGIDHEIDAAAIDAPGDAEMSAAARHDGDRARSGDTRLRHRSVGTKPPLCSSRVRRESALPADETLPSLQNAPEQYPGPNRPEKVRARSRTSVARA